MKFCTRCSASNLDEDFSCKACGGNMFYTSPAPGERPKPTSRFGALRNAFSSGSVLMLIGVCVLALMLEASFRWVSLSKLAANLGAERARAAKDQAVILAEQNRAAQLRLDQEEAVHSSQLTNAALLSGVMARDRHEKEWSLRTAHDPSLAKTVLETNLLTMEQLGQDATLAAQTALERVARLASPRDSRVEVAQEGDGFRVRVAFMMSRLSSQEAGAVTKHHTTAAMRAEIQELSAQVLRDLYEYCGSRGIISISVTCNHTLRQSLVPAGATEEERVLLLERAKPIPGRLYRVSLDQAHAKKVVDWRGISLGRVIGLGSVEYDGLTHLTITQDRPLNQEEGDPGGELEF
jgi:hypothetical protein